MAHTTSWEPRGIVVEYRDQVTDLEVQRVVTNFQADHRYDDVRYILHDFSRVDRISHSPEVMVEISAQDSAAALSNPEHRVAIFPWSPALEAMVEDYLSSGLRGRDKVRLFADSHSARRWAEA